MRTICAITDVVFHCSRSLFIILWVNVLLYLSSARVFPSKDHLITSGTTKHIQKLKSSWQRVIFFSYKDPRNCRKLLLQPSRLCLKLQFVQPDRSIQVEKRQVSGNFDTCLGATPFLDFITKKNEHSSFDVLIQAQMSRSNILNLFGSWNKTLYCSLIIMKSLSNYRSCERHPRPHASQHIDCSACCCSSPFLFSFCFSYPQTHVLT